MRKARFLFLIAAVLSTALFTACNQGAEGTGAATENGTTETASSGLNIVHIQSDSLQTGYTALAKELARLEENFTKAQENLSRDGNALQREAVALQNKAQQGLLSPNQINAEQQRLAQKEQEILQRREVALGSIQEEQLQMQAAFTAQVKEILEKIREENGYDYIVNQAAGSGILAANSNLDITPMVLERLNALDTTALQTAIEQ